MKENEIKEIILKYIIEEFGISNVERTKHYSYCKCPEEDCCCKILTDFGGDTSLIMSGYIDSFSMVSVLMFIENIFSIKIPGLQAVPENFDTVNKMVDLVLKIKNC